MSCTTHCERRLDGAHQGAEVPAWPAPEREMRPLLVIDGDSLAHRAYHALPKSMRSATGLPSGAIVGFANFLLRLWQSEGPRAVLVGWDCVGKPTYRSEAFPTYQRGRVLDPEILVQLEL